MIEQSSPAIRNSSIDWLKLVLAIMVVGIHVQVHSGEKSIFAWMTFDGLFRIAVPCFLCINGYYFQASKNPALWIQRIFLLYIIWSILYLPFWIGFDVPAKFIARNLVFGWWHIWYLAAVVFASLAVLLLRRWGNTQLKVLATIVFCTGMAISYAVQFDLGPRLNGVLRTELLLRNGLFIGFPFFVAGYLVHAENIASKWGTRPTFLLLAVAVGMLLIESWFMHAGAPGRRGIELMSSLALLAPLLLIAALKVRIPGPGKLIGKVSNGIYFTHIAAIYALDGFKAQGVIYFTLVMLLSIAAAFLLIKIDRDRFGIVKSIRQYAAPLELKR